MLILIKDFATNTYFFSKHKKSPILYYLRTKLLTDEFT